METKVIEWMNREDTERLLAAMRVPFKRDKAPAAKPTVVVLQGAPRTEGSAEESFNVHSL
jgi:hypothetical protein